jgi:hypothetical protein
MFGVPITLAGVASCLFNPWSGVAVSLFGYSFQVVGHLVFEKNQPVLLTTGDPRIIVYAIVLVSRDWMRFFHGRLKYTGNIHKSTITQPAKIAR